MEIIVVTTNITKQLIIKDIRRWIGGAWELISN